MTEPIGVLTYSGVLVAFRESVVGSACVDRMGPLFSSLEPTNLSCVLADSQVYLVNPR